MDKIAKPSIPRRNFEFRPVDRTSRQPFCLRRNIAREVGRDTPIWKLEAALKCRSCEHGRYAPPVHLIKLTIGREITPYDVWEHPDDDDRR